MSKQITIEEVEGGFIVTEYQHQAGARAGDPVAFAEPKRHIITTPRRLRSYVRDTFKNGDEE